MTVLSHYIKPAMTGIRRYASIGHAAPLFIIETFDTAFVFDSTLEAKGFIDACPGLVFAVNDNTNFYYRGLTC